MELATVVNALLFGLFLLFKMLLLLTKQGSNCGCFGAHELIAVDRASIGTSISILGLAILLTILVQRAANPLSWITAIIFLLVFGWVVFKTLERRRLEGRLIQEVSTLTPK